MVVRLFDPDFAIRVQHGFKHPVHPERLAPGRAGLRGGRRSARRSWPRSRSAIERVILFARLRVPAGSMLEGRLASSLGEPGALRVLAVADPGSEDARWDFPADEVMDRRRGGRRGGDEGRAGRPAPPGGDPRSRRRARNPLSERSLPQLPLCIARVDEDAHIDLIADWRCLGGRRQGICPDVGRPGPDGIVTPEEWRASEAERSALAYEAARDEYRLHLRGDPHTEPDAAEAPAARRRRVSPAGCRSGRAGGGPRSRRRSTSTRCTCRARRGRPRGGRCRSPSSHRTAGGPRRRSSPR